MTKRLRCGALQWYAAKSARTRRQEGSLKGREKATERACMLWHRVQPRNIAEEGEGSAREREKE